MAEYVDYGDICNALEERFGKEKEEATYFYFFEYCQDEGKLKNCQTYEEAEDIVLELFELEGHKW